MYSSQFKSKYIYKYIHTYIYTDICIYLYKLDLPFDCTEAVEHHEVGENSCANLYILVEKVNQ